MLVAAVPVHEPIHDHNKISTIVIAELEMEVAYQRLCHAAEITSKICGDTCRKIKAYG
jgi:hypothetical protein